MTKPVVTIRHSGDEPVVTVEPDEAVEIVMIDGLEEGTRILEYSGVSVYQTWKDNDILSDYWIATCAGINWESDVAFDSRDLDSPPALLEPKYEELFPDDQTKQALAYNIDKGRITEDGYEPK